MADADPYADLPPINSAAQTAPASSSSDPYGDLPAKNAPASDPYATGGPGAITPPTSAGFGMATTAAQRAAVKATTDFGNWMQQGHKNPIGAFLDKTQGGQRFLQTIGNQAFGDYDPTLDPVKALMNPATAPATQAASDKWMGIGPDGPITNALGGPNGNVAQKVLQGGAHAIADSATNPISYVNPAKVAGTVANAIPGATPALAAAGKAIGNSPLGAMFNPDYYLRGLTDQGKALYESITNKAMEAVRGQKQVEDAVVKQFAPQIRAGQMPPEVAQLFTSKTGLDLPTLVRPGAPMGALNAAEIPKMEAPIDQIQLNMSNRVNQRPDFMSRTSGVNSSVTPNATGPKGLVNARPGGVARGATVTPSIIPPPQLPPNIRPGAPASALNASVVPNVVPPAGSMKNAFTDTMSRSNPGQSTMDAWKSIISPDLLDASGNLKIGTNPADIQMALFRNRAPVFKSLALPELQKAGFFNSPSSLAAGRSMGVPDSFDVPTEGLGNASYVANGAAPHPIIELQKRLEANLDQPATKPSVIAKMAQGATRLGNQAFLANPLPHVGNLANLTYNRYGTGTALQGLVNGARIATGNVGGDLADQIGQLEATGTKSQYGNIFNELGFTGLPNSSATNPLATAYNATVAPASRVAAKAVNVPLIWGQRASNAAQNTILNSAETGLRSAALGAENAAGTDPLQAAKNIHATLGTNAPNGITEGLRKLAVPFAGFHYQTAPGSVINTLANNPGRIVNAVQTERDMNNALGTKYRSTVPGVNATRMLADPLGYFGNAGGILGLENPNSMLSNAKEGGKGVLKAIAAGAARYTPGSQPGFDAAKVGVNTYNQMLNNGPQTNYAPLFNAAFGGYTAK